MFRCWMAKMVVSGSSHHTLQSKIHFPSKVYLACYICSWSYTVLLLPGTPLNNSSSLPKHIRIHVYIKCFYSYCFEAVAALISRSSSEVLLVCRSWTGNMNIADRQDYLLFPWMTINYCTFSRWHVLNIRLCVHFFFKISVFVFSNNQFCRSQWPRGLRHELPSLALKLGSWVRIPLKTWLSVYVFSVFVFCVYAAVLRWTDPPSKKTYRLCTRSRNWKSGQGPIKGFRAKIKIIIIISNQLWIVNSTRKTASGKA
jgi:hypothetical protein